MAMGTLWGTMLIKYYYHTKEISAHLFSMLVGNSSVILRGGGQTFLEPLSILRGGPMYGQSFWQSFWTSAPNRLRATPRPNMEPEIAISPRWS